MKRIMLAAMLFGIVTATAQTKETAIGCWKMPSKPGERLRLAADGTFFFDDYTEMVKSTVRYRGTWKKEGKTITLMYDDRAQQRFFLYKDKRGKWRLRKAGGFQLVKVPAMECQPAMGGASEGSK
jgi:hypothetical protein